MNRVLLTILFALVLALPAYADVTIKQTNTGKGMGVSGTTASTSYIKGNKMRMDTVQGDKTISMIFDIDAQKMYMFESKKKDAEVWDMGSFAHEIGTSVDTANMKVSLKPNGQTKEIAGKTATGYDMDISIPATMGGNKEMTLVVSLTGPTWIVKGAPGTPDFLRFYKAAADKGWVFSDPRVAKASPGPARAMAEMYRQLAEAGGIPYETQMDIKMGGGSGPLAGILAKMGNMSTSSMVESIDTAPLPDDLFAVPAGYKVNTKK